MKRKFTKLATLAVVLALVSTLFTACGGVAVKDGQYYSVGGANSTDNDFVRSVEIKGDRLVHFNSSYETNSHKWLLEDGVLYVEGYGEKWANGLISGNLLLYVGSWYLHEGSVADKIEDGCYKPMNDYIGLKLFDWQGSYDSDFALEFKGDKLMRVNDVGIEEYEWTLKNEILSLTDNQGEKMEEPCIGRGDAFLLGDR